MNKGAVYPKVKLVISPARDAEIGVNFLKFRRLGRSRTLRRKFYPTEILPVVMERISAKKRDRLIKAYARRIHKERSREIKRGVAQARTHWASVEKRYFRLVDRIFKKHPWPKGRYKGFASVFWMFPRDVSEKTFFFPYAHKLPCYANKIIAHELLHFMFFDYIGERYGLRKHSKIPGKPNDYVWKVSEAFNTAMEQWAPYRRLFRYGGRSYAEIEAMVKRMAAQWRRRQDVDLLLDQWFEGRMTKIKK
ncbi:MAG: hypothetical protein V1696_01830 [Candidatus Jorgensenbacteria bacterium]